MKFYYFLIFLLHLGLNLNAHVYDHQHLTTFSMNGNQITGVATPLMGCHEVEVWKSSIAPKNSTPLHVHESEEIFIFLKGEGKVLIGEHTYFYKAPCTLVLPPKIPHQIFNTGDVATEHFAILKAESIIQNMEGDVMQLPWRK